jgi:hypothetical protein
MRVIIPNRDWLAWLAEQKSLMLAKDPRSGRCAWRVPNPDQDGELAEVFLRRLEALPEETEPRLIRQAKSEARTAFEWLDRQMRLYPPDRVPPRPTEPIHFGPTAADLAEMRDNLTKAPVITTDMTPVSEVDKYLRALHAKVPPMTEPELDARWAETVARVRAQREKDSDATGLWARGTHAYQSATSSER